MAGLLAGDVELPEGRIFCQSPINLGTGQSGRSITGGGDGTTIIYGVEINSVNLWPLHSSDPEWLECDPSARGQIRMIDCDALGISLGNWRWQDSHFTAQGLGQGSADLLVQVSNGAMPMTIAASAKGFDRHTISSVDGLDIYTDDTSYISPVYAGHRFIEIMPNEFASRLVGMSNDFADGRLEMLEYPSIAIDPSKQLRFRVLNSLHNLTEPGEYVIDWARKKIYLIPLNENHAFYIHYNPFDFFNLDGASNVSVNNVCILGTRRGFVSVKNGSGNSFSNCLFLGGHKHGVQVQDSESLSLNNVHFEDCQGPALYAYHAANLQGAGLPNPMPFTEKMLNLSYGGISVIQCCAVRMSKLFSQQPTFYFQNGTPNVIVGSCYIKDVPGIGVYVNTPGFVVSQNIIYSACKVSADLGAIYSGRSAIYQGGVIAQNGIRDIRTPIITANKNAAIYGDDGNCGVKSRYNYIKDCDAAFHNNGGRYNSYLRNKLDNCDIVQIMGAGGGVGLAGQAVALEFCNQVRALVPFWNLTNWTSLIGEAQVNDLLALNAAVSSNPTNLSFALSSVGWTFGAGGYAGFLQNTGCTAEYKASDIIGVTPIGASWNNGYAVNSNSSDGTTVNEPSWTKPPRPLEPVA